VKSSTRCSQSLHCTLQCTFRSYLYNFQELLVHWIPVPDVHCTTNVPSTRSTELRLHCTPSLYFQDLLVPLSRAISPPGFLVLCYLSTAHVISLYSSVYFQKLLVSFRSYLLASEVTCPLGPSVEGPVIGVQ
jgi:hypothetical protein